MAPKRDWSLANLKRERDPYCRVCRARPVEMAHVTGRAADHYLPDGTTKQPGAWVVFPERVIPLCPDHHRQYDEHRLDLLGHLTTQEEAQAVLDSRGLESARVRLCPGAYGPTKVAA